MRAKCCCCSVTCSTSAIRKGDRFFLDQGCIGSRDTQYMRRVHACPHQGPVGGGEQIAKVGKVSLNTTHDYSTCLHRAGCLDAFPIQQRKRKGRRKICRLAHARIADLDGGAGIEMASSTRGLGPFSGGALRKAFVGESECWAENFQQ